MLDFTSKKLLNVLHAECLGSGYKVFSFSELVMSLPENYGVDQEEVRNVLKNLNAREYINIRYEDDGEVCLCVLAEGRALVENDFQEIEDRKRIEKRLLISSFMGGACGGILMAVMFAILFFCFGVRNA